MHWPSYTTRCAGITAGMPEQIEQEVTAFNRLALAVYKDFGFEDIAIRLTLRPEKRIGSDQVWDRAEAALRAALKAG